MFQSLKSSFFKQSKKTRFLISLLAIIVVFLLFRMILEIMHAKKRVTPLVSVATASVKTANVPVYFSALGTVNPDTTITVKTQISGILTHVYFKDGQMVKAGDVLAEIDSRPYQAQLLQYQGQLLRDSALLQNAKVDTIRYQNLYKSNSVSQQILNTQESLDKQYQGAVQIDQGQINTAKTNIDYCKIVSPISGRIGIGIVDQGNYVQTSDAAGIAVITTLDPVDVVFSLPEDNLPIISKAFHGEKKLIVDAYDRTQNKLLAQGELAAIDNQVNTATGTVNYKAEFNNPDDVLFPNQFVNIKLQVTTLLNAIIIPTEAIQQSADGTYVYRYNTNKTVNHVAVKTGVVDGENTVITEGLSLNQIIVTAGTDKLFDGAKVSISGKTV